MKWWKLDPFERTKKVLRAVMDPLYFCEEPAFLNVHPTPMQAKILRNFYRNEDGVKTDYNELIVMAGMRGGKCVAGHCTVKNAKTGEEYTVEEIFEKGLRFPILTYANGKIYCAYDWMITKDLSKPVYGVKTETGKIVYVTHDHPILTDSGWKKPTKIRPGEGIACIDNITPYNVDKPRPEVTYETMKGLIACPETITYDFHVKHYHCLVCNDIIIHNTFLASLFALYEAFNLLILEDPAAAFGLAPGSEIFIMNVAVSERQALDTVFAQISAKFERSPFFQAQDYKTYSDEIRFKEKRIVVRSMSSSSASGVGRTAKAVMFDELARFQDTGGQRSGWEVYHSLSRATRTFGLNGKRIVIGSPLFQGDIITELYRKAQTHPNMLAYHMPTWTLNPRITFESLRDELERDPIAFWRDYGAEPAMIVEAYFRDPSILTVNHNRPNLLQMIYDGLDIHGEDHFYVLAGDPALKHDAFGLSLAHAEKGKIIIDGLFRFDPLREIDPFEVKDFILKVYEKVPFLYAVFDTWNFPIVQKMIAQRGVVVVNHMVKKEDYDRVKEMIYKKQIDICDYPFVMEEMRFLEIINQKRVDHPKGHSKDVADALCNAVWALTDEEILENLSPKYHFVKVV